MESAALSFVGHSAQIPFDKLVNIIRIDWPFLPPSAFLFVSDSPVQSGGSHQCQFVMVKYVRLRTTNSGIYRWGTVGLVAQQELPDKPPAAKGAKKTTSDRL